jgi:hypothetical protein
VCALRAGNENENLNGLANFQYILQYKMLSKPAVWFENLIHAPQGCECA